MNSKFRTNHEAVGSTPSSGAVADESSPFENLMQRAAELLCHSFDTAIESVSGPTRMTNARIGSKAGISEKAVRLARGLGGGEFKPLSAVREMFLPRQVFYAYAAAKAAAYETLHGGVLTGNETSQVHMTNAAALAFLTASNEALSDGRLSAHEARDLLTALSTIDQRSLQLRIALTQRILNEKAAEPA